jgi:hypothetical protein
MCDFTEEKKELLKCANEKMGICEDQSTEKNKNLIFVYCPPKVGSTTLITSFRLCALNKFTIFHIHDELMLKVLCGIENVTVNEIILYNGFLGKNVYVVDIYRSPIEHKISIFFEKLSSFHFNNTEENVNNYNVNKIIKRFNSLFPFLSRSDYYKEVYNIQFPQEFDFSNKYLNQHINGVKYIKLRLNDSNEWQSILNSIFQSNIKIINDYETEKKPIKDIYKQFKESYRIPSNLLQMVENCESLKYYYSQEERENYLNIWRSKQSEIFSPFSQEQYFMYNELAIENQHIGEIQRTHYIDTGCTCVGCKRKRQILIYKINNGESVNETIDHTQANNEYNALLLQKKKQKMNKILQAVSKINQLNYAQKQTGARGIIKGSFIKQIK